MSEQYDVLFYYTPFLLERVIYHTIQGILMAIRLHPNPMKLTSQSYDSPSRDSRDSSRANSPKPLPPRSIFFSVTGPSSPRQKQNPPDRQVYNVLFQQYWNLIKLLRDLPAEYVVYSSHVLHSGLFMILR